ncbi:hypothetical protein SISNIDRAFT_452743 [Sistotremastrum niveocremeum HHB9708]|uniref:Protein MON2 homolog n=1 Tax=Sistotremastrum niveocremeum HHB9708 TaxID=1314777 RepID=A0A164WTE6_9AGAM|nr:hypothetical protein SISNIDRAFT_452743 [Sistotremastrum niveocremeum HHB9708]
MGSLAFLVTELQSLSSESRRKHPEIRDAAEKSLSIIRSTPDASQSTLLTSPHSSEILKPLFISLSTKNAKIVAIALSSVQRLITLRVLPQSAASVIVEAMIECMNQGVDIQLRVLQTILGLVTNFRMIHGELLGEALYVCFKLQESRIAVVSSTAAATLRQLVMFIVGDQVLSEDKLTPPPPSLSSPITLPDGSSIHLPQAAQDAYHVFEDLCLMANSEKPRLLKLDGIPKTFALELVESILTNYHQVMRKHPEQLLLTSHHLCPFLLQTLHSKPLFPLTLRATRVVFLLIKQFSDEFQNEVEVFLGLIIRTIAPGSTTGGGGGDGRGEGGGEGRPLWVRVISTEILRGLCSDAELMRKIYTRYDAPKSQSSSSSETSPGSQSQSHEGIFTSLLSALNRLSTEKPSLLGTSSQMQGIVPASFLHPHPPHTSHNSHPNDLNPGGGGYGIDVAGVAIAGSRIVASAASAAGGMVGIPGMGMGGGEEVGLSAGSSMKLQCIDQLDKSDAPPIPETYIYLLGLQCLCLLSDGFAGYVLPVYNTLSRTRPSSSNPTLSQGPQGPQSSLPPSSPGPFSASPGPLRAPPALDLSKLPPSPQTTSLLTIHAMLSQGWPPLLASLSFYISTSLSTPLFGDTLSAFQNLIMVSGALGGGLDVARDAFLGVLGKGGVPGRVVGALDSYSSPYSSQEPATPRTGLDGLGLGFVTGSGGSNNSGAGGGGGGPGLSQRNMACLKVLISCAVFLGGSLGEAWFGVLEIVQNASYVLSLKSSASNPAGKRHASIPSTAGGGSGGTRSVSSTLPTSSSTQSPGQGTPGSGGPGGAEETHPILQDTDPTSLLDQIRRLIESTKNLDDEAFRAFVESCCRLSLEMIGMQSSVPMPPPQPSIIIESGSVEEEKDGDGGKDGSLKEKEGSPMLSPRAGSEKSHRRRASGIHLPRTLRSGDFGLTTLSTISLLNIPRLIYRPPSIAWNSITSHFLSVLSAPYVPPNLRIQASRALDDILVVVPRNLGASASSGGAAGGVGRDVQGRVFQVLAQQISSIRDTHNSGGGGGGGGGVVLEIQKMGLETLLQILQSSVHTLQVGWETIFEVLGSVCKPPSSTTKALSLSSDSLSSLPLVFEDSPSTSTIATSAASATSPVTPTPKSKPPPLSLPSTSASEKGNATLVRIAFQSVTLLSDNLNLFTSSQLRLYISTLGSFGRQSDTNIALTAAASLLWTVSDAIQSKRKILAEEPEYSKLWMDLLMELLGLCEDGRAEVRVGAIQTLFRSLLLYGETLSTGTWDECLWKVTLPLLDVLTTAVRQSTHQSPPPTATATLLGIEQTNQWDESKALAFTSIGSLLESFIVSKILKLEDFEKVWDALIRHVQDAFMFDSSAVSTAALRALEKALKAASKHPSSSEEGEGVEKGRVGGAVERVWASIEEMGSVISRRTTAPQSPSSLSSFHQSQSLSQESLLVLVEVIEASRGLSKTVREEEWEVGRLGGLLGILKSVLTYPNSRSYRPDVDNVTPVQGAVLRVVSSIDLTQPKAISLVLSDLAEYATLPFLAAFDIPSEYQNGSANKKSAPRRLSYIAVCKKAMPKVVEIYDRFRGRREIYVDGTVEAILSAYSIPIKLKYDCPAPSVHGHDEPLWKTATVNFLKIVKDCVGKLHEEASDIPAERIEAIWHQLIDGFRGGLLADCSVAESFPLEVQEQEENFDVQLLASLEDDIIPHIGDARIPSHLITQLSDVLQRSSRIHDFDEFEDGLGTTAGVPTIPRERFSYWCFDLLFVVCSRTTEGDEKARRRLAAIALPALMSRCKSVLTRYVADQSLRGPMPLPRARQEELLYVLHKLLNLRLWDGSLWASYSDDPSKYCAALPEPNTGTKHEELLADLTKRGPRAHLFHLYPILCEIIGNGEASPRAWVFPVRRPSKSLPPPPSSEVEPNDPKASPKEDTESSASTPALSPVAIELDARDLVFKCLREIGKEMGLIA